MLTQLSEEEKVRKLKFLKNLFKKIYVDFSIFKTVRTQKELLLALGHSEGELEYTYTLDQLNKEITYNEIKETETCRELSLTQELWRVDSTSGEQDNRGWQYPPEIFPIQVEECGNLQIQSTESTFEHNPRTSTESEKPLHENFSSGSKIESKVQEESWSNSENNSITKSESGKEDLSNNQIEVINNRQTTESRSSNNSTEVLKRVEPIRFQEDEKDILESLYPLTSLTRTKRTKFFVHQKKEIRLILDCFLRKDHRAHLTQAGTGTGKTFIAGGLIEQLWNPSLQFFKGCISPWPCIYITRASIVEQTYRVMERYKDDEIGFGLQRIKQCHVINIEQLRAEFGKFFLKIKTRVTKGKEYLEWEWIPVMAPRLVIVDESHLAKNEGSTQSKIIQSMSLLPNIKILFMSATSFMRISETRYFSVNCAKKIN